MDEPAAEVESEQDMEEIRRLFYEQDMEEQARCEKWIREVKFRKPNWMKSKEVMFQHLQERTRLTMVCVAFALAK